MLKSAGFVCALLDVRDLSGAERKAASQLEKVAAAHAPPAAHAQTEPELEKDLERLQVLSFRTWRNVFSSLGSSKLRACLSNCEPT